MIHFFKLIRPLNLAIIALTMYSMRFFYYQLAYLKPTVGHDVWHERIDFFLLVLSTVLIAAAGNIINDYFDVKADRINRPDRLIIGKHIKSGWAIMSHWLLNGIAFSISIYLSFRYNTFWYVFVHLISINTLWFYSIWLKRKMLIGNIFIALLTAMVPILCGIHFYLTGTLDRSYFDQFTNQDSIYFSNWIYFMAEDGRFIIAMSIFAFILNVSREIIKDIQDIEGDQLIHAKTLPMVVGNKKSGYITSFLLLTFPSLSLVLYFSSVPFSMYDFFFFLPLLFAILFSIMISIFLLGKHEIKIFRLFDRSLKLAMLFGVIIPYYWYFFN